MSCGTMRLPTGSESIFEDLRIHRTHLRGGGRGDMEQPPPILPPQSTHGPNQHWHRRLEAKILRHVKEEINKKGPPLD